MVDVKSKKCYHDGCLKKPSFGIAGSKTPTFCAEHAAEGMVNVIEKKCKHESCSKQPSFGFAGSKSGTFCAQHALEGMINITRKRCRYENCSKQPSFGIAGSKGPTFCAEHAAESISIVKRETSFENRGWTSTLNTLEEEDGTINTCCRTHSSAKALGITHDDHVKVEMKLEH